MSNHETDPLGLLAGDLADIGLHDEILRSTVRFALFLAAARFVFFLGRDGLGRDVLERAAAFFGFRCAAGFRVRATSASSCVRSNGFSMTATRP